MISGIFKMIMFSFLCFFSCRDSELMSTIETLQLNNKRLIEQQSAIQAQVI